MNVQEAIKKYKTATRIVGAKDVPLEIKFSAVIYQHGGETMKQGYESLGAMALSMYGLAYALFNDHAKAMEAISVAINLAQEDFKELNHDIL